MENLRVDGQTIKPHESYDGNRVIKLLNVSFENGYNRAMRELSESSSSYDEGYKNGYADASEDLRSLKEILLRVLGLEEE